MTIAQNTIIHTSISVIMTGVQQMFGIFGLQYDLMPCRYIISPILMFTVSLTVCHLY